MATIREQKGKTGITYRVEIRLKGHPRVSANFERKTDARKWAQKTESDIRDGRYFKTREAHRHTLSELVERYIRDVLPSKAKWTKQGQTNQLEWWKNQIGNHSLADITPALIAEYRDRLAAEPTPRGPSRSPATVVRYLAALSHAFTIAIKEWGWVEENPVQKVSKPKEPRGRVRFLSEDERNHLLKACKQSTNKDLYPAVVLALSTGARQQEIMGIRWPDADINRGLIILHKT